MCACVFVTKTNVCQIKHGANFIKTISLRKYLVFHTQYLFIESDFVFALEYTARTDRRSASVSGDISISDTCERII